MLHIDRLGCKGKLGNHIFGIFKIAIEGVGLGGNVDIICSPYAVPIILHVQTVHLERMAMDAIIGIIVAALDNKSVFSIVSQARLAKLFKFPASWHRENVHVVCEEIFALLYLPFNVLSLPLKPIGNLGKLGFSLVCRKRAVLIE